MRTGWPWWATTGTTVLWTIGAWTIGAECTTGWATIVLWRTGVWWTIGEWTATIGAGATTVLTTGLLWWTTWLHWKRINLYFIRNGSEYI